MSECGMGNSDIKPKTVVQTVGNSETCSTNKCTEPQLLHQPMDETVDCISNLKDSEQHHYPKSNLDQRRQEIGVKYHQKPAMNVSVLNVAVLVYVQSGYLYMFTVFDIFT